MISVLFVCLGNICRSPMAEAVFRNQLQLAHLTSHIKTDSAGTGDWHVGQPPHEGTQKKLRAEGISVDGIYARQIHPDDLKNFTYIVVMDHSNFENVTQLASGATSSIHHLVDFIPDTSYREVPDPWYTGDFEETYSLVTQGCTGLLAHIRKNNPID
ncbi:low molecular weight phosphotyrosine protein phosphatase [Hazenella sp. IB182357]|uniref:protein-tyrosine-phosphatase n=1 Tax=Polycladospora coralii TaxID=2771432 RepID=A0A926NAP6_9BACL|nr:low molecular weight protein-tyrosine-phosphatase [Polycladospora coralii]MBD1371765.1 low molecular weight phosphotyrosine protein phosphatase [Polycladospora coralii]MBS7529226.1 low molecular weight phosphotyrosine protein phosphatase [Polycladospora coralii]